LARNLRRTTQARDPLASSATGPPTDSDRQLAGVCDHVDPASASQDTRFAPLPRVREMNICLSVETTPVPPENGSTKTLSTRQRHRVETMGLFSNPRMPWPEPQTGESFRFLTTRNTARVGLRRSDTRALRSDKALVVRLLTFSLREELATTGFASDLMKETQRCDRRLAAIPSSFLTRLAFTNTASPGRRS
jgi:hypothetical protein